MEIPIIVSVWRVNISKLTPNVPQGGTKDSFMVILAHLQKKVNLAFIYLILMWCDTAR